MKIRIAGTVNDSIVDGPGFRYTIFTQGCPHHCPGCHNPETHDFSGGRDADTDEIVRDFSKNILLSGITLSGGEPFCQAEALTVLAKKIKSETSKDLWIYSGYTFEDIIKDEVKKNLLKECDVLVDGKFEKDNKGLNMRFKGSYNQRIIDIKKSLEENKAVLYEL